MQRLEVNVFCVRVVQVMKMTQKYDEKFDNTLKKTTRSCSVHAGERCAK